MSVFFIELRMIQEELTFKGELGAKVLHSVYLSEDS